MDNFIPWFWKNGVNYILYIILMVISLWIAKNIMWFSVKNKYDSWNHRLRVRHVKANVIKDENKTYTNPMLAHLNRLLKITAKNETKDMDVISFAILSLLVGLMGAVFFLFTNGDLILSIVLGTLLSSIPYLILLLRLNKLRNVINTDFLLLVQQLAQNYNAVHHNMYRGLVETQKEIKDPMLRRVIVRLISDLQVSKNEEELRNSIHLFAYAAGTNWAKRLGSIILKSYLYNENVLGALMSLTKHMEETEEMLEEEKSYTMDTVYNGYLTLPIFIGALILGYFTSGVQDWFNLQFKHDGPLMLFFLSLMGVVFSIIISAFLKRPKNDL